MNMSEQQYSAYLKRIGRTVTALETTSKAVSTKKPPKPLHEPSGYSSEAEFQMALVKRLEGYGYTVFEMLKGSKNGGPVFCTKGMPDLCLMRGETTFWIELKHGENDRSEAQILLHKKIHSSGNLVFTCWNDAEVDLVLVEMREMEEK